jgi:hypothetical protein
MPASLVQQAVAFCCDYLANSTTAMAKTAAPMAVAEDGAKQKLGFAAGL